MDGRAWIAALPPELDAQGRAVTRLLDFCQQTPEVASLSVGCSLGRGAADGLSDVDAAIGVDADRGTAGADRVRAVERSLIEHVRGADLVDVLREEPAAGALVIRRVFAQLRDGVQLDLAVVAEAEVRRGDAAPDFVPVYRAAGRAEDATGATGPSAYDVSGEQIHRWTFLGWRALLDADKYLRRGSAWEARQRLEEARQHIWALWAAARGTSYPWHGLSQVLDHDPAALPPGIEATVAGLDLAELRAAALASAGVLDDVSAAAARRCPTALPTGLAGFARGVLDGSISWPGARPGTR